MGDHRQKCSAPTTDIMFLVITCVKKPLFVVMQLKKPQKLSVWDWTAAFSDYLRQPHPKGGWTGAVLQGSAAILELSTWQSGIDGILKSPSVLLTFLSEPDTLKEKSLSLPSELYLGCSREGHKEFSTLLGNIFKFIKSFFSSSSSLSFSTELQVPAGIIKTKSFASELIEVSLSTALYNFSWK